MATLTELKTLMSDPGIKDKVQSAIVIVGMEVLNENPQPGNHSARVAYAKRVMENPDSEADAWIRVLVGDNHTLSVAQIQGASDDAVLNAVRGSWNLFVE